MPQRTGNLVRTVAIGVAVAAVASACGTPSDDGGATKAGKKGGTINVLMETDFEHLDPQRSNLGRQISVGKLLYPTLTNYPSAPGDAGRKLVADSATDTGKANPAKTRWSFTVRPGLKWQDGKPVSCADFKYGVERSFSDLITEGPTYQKEYLVGGDSYPGIYKAPQGLPSVSCAGNVITYNLVRPISDFNFTVAMPVFAAVRKDKDTRAKYDDQIFSYGPYQFAGYKPDANLKLVRNKNWDQNADKVRKNLPDVWNFDMGVSQDDMAGRLVASNGKDASAISLGSPITADQAATVKGDPAVAKRTVSGLDGYVYYLAINNRKITDVKCRQAYTYLTDKKSYLTALGGPDFGEYAQTMIAPTLSQAHKKIDPYGLKNKPEGDVAKAKQLLAQSPTCPKAITFAFRTGNSADDRAAAAIKAGFARGGVNVTLSPIPRAQYISTISKPASQPELTINNWYADWPSASTVIPPNFDGRTIEPEGNSNRSLLNNPAINAGIDAALKEPDFAKSQKMWGDLDEQIQQQAAVIPLRYVKNVTVVGTKVTGGFLDSVYSDVNLGNVGVA